MKVHFTIEALMSFSLSILFKSAEQTICKVKLHNDNNFSLTIPFAWQDTVVLIKNNRRHFSYFAYSYRLLIRAQVNTVSNKM